MQNITDIVWPNLLHRFQEGDPTTIFTVLSLLLLSLLYLLDIPLPLKIAKLKKDLGYFLHPGEIAALFVFKFTHKLPQLPKGLPKDANYCYDSLVKVSRSFSAVILELNEELRDPICVFYLVLRGLDTIEDDMIPPIEEKVKQLHEFYTHLEERGWNIGKTGRSYGTAHEKELLDNFDNVVDTFLGLKPLYREVIADICKRMGYGMAEFLQKEVVTVKDYELYCHYVAGLVGIGLSGLFSRSGTEDPKFAKVEDMSNSMGLFLQKTNIIRDYLDDISQNPPRIFYPKEVWEVYGQHFEDFRSWKNKKGALKMLNHMITDAMKHSFDCLEYLKMPRDPSVFKFCAIPQVMAIATLHLCYNNHDVFRYEVKIRKGEAVKLILACNSYENVVKLFYSYSAKIAKQIPKGDPNGEKLRQRIAALQAKIKKENPNLGY